MGLYDRLVFEDGIDVSFPESDINPTAVTWQTKSIGRPALENYKVTRAGRPFEQKT